MFLDIYEHQEKYLHKCTSLCKKFKLSTYTNEALYAGEWEWEWYGEEARKITSVQNTDMNNRPHLERG